MRNAKGLGDLKLTLCLVCQDLCAFWAAEDFLSKLEILGINSASQAKQEVTYFSIGFIHPIACLPRSHYSPLIGTVHQSRKMCPQRHSTRPILRGKKRYPTQSLSSRSKSCLEIQRDGYGTCAPGSSQAGGPAWAPLAVLRYSCIK